MPLPVPNRRRIFVRRRRAWSSSSSFRVAVVVVGMTIFTAVVMLPTCSGSTLRAKRRLDQAYDYSNAGKDNDGFDSSGHVPNEPMAGVGTEPQTATNEMEEEPTVETNVQVENTSGNRTSTNSTSGNSTNGTNATDNESLVVIHSVPTMKNSSDNDGHSNATEEGTSPGDAEAIENEIDNDTKFPLEDEIDQEIETEYGVESNTTMKYGTDAILASTNEDPTEQEMEDGENAVDSNSNSTTGEEAYNSAVNTTQTEVMDAANTSALGVEMEEETDAPEPLPETKSPSQSVDQEGSSSSSDDTDSISSTSGSTEPVSQSEVSDESHSQDSESSSDDLNDVYEQISETRAHNDENAEEKEEVEGPATAPTTEFSEAEEENETEEEPTSSEDAAGPTNEDDEVSIAEAELEAEFQKELKHEENVARGVGGLGLFLAILAMIFTAYQMSENPDGLYASICRLAITLVGCVLKIVFMPCRKLVGASDLHHGHMPVSTMDYGYKDTYKGNGNGIGFEMS